MTGVASRRRADELIAAGRVRVNGAPVPPGGMMVTPGRDRVEVDGAALARLDHRYFAANKPAGHLSAVRDRSRRPLVIDLLGKDAAGMYPVGRLDRESRGLILLTNDGELSHRVQHPRHHLEKEYRVVVRGRPNAAATRRLRRGVVLEEGQTAPADVELVGDGPIPGTTELTMVLRQGWKRQVRRSLRAVGHEVIDLHRVRIGPLAIGDLAEGAVRELTPAEVAALRAAVGLEAPA
jgi:pseudouridine synthase